METTPRPRRERRRRRRLLAFLTVGMLVGSVTTTALSLAQFTNSATATGSLGAGKVELQANGSLTGTVTFAAVKLVPSNTTWVSGLIKVTNTGDADVNYTVAIATAASVTGKPDLAETLQMRVTRYTGAALCGDAGGAQVYNNSMIPASNPFIAANALAAAGEQDLCVEVHFPNGTPGHDNPYQGAGTTVTFTFAADQIVV